MRAAWLVLAPGLVLSPPVSALEDLSVLVGRMQDSAAIIVAELRVGDVRGIKYEGLRLSRVGAAIIDHGVTECVQAFSALLNVTNDVAAPMMPRLLVDLERDLAAYSEWMPQCEHLAFE